MIQTRKQYSFPRLLQGLGLPMAAAWIAVILPPGMSGFQGVETPPARYAKTRAELERVRDARLGVLLRDLSQAVDRWQRFPAELAFGVEACTVRTRIEKTHEKFHLEMVQVIERFKTEAREVIEKLRASKGPEERVALIESLGGKISSLSKTVEIFREAAKLATTPIEKEEYEGLVARYSAHMKAMASDLENLRRQNRESAGGIDKEVQAHEANIERLSREQMIHTAEAQTHNIRAGIVGVTGLMLYEGTQWKSIRESMNSGPTANPEPRQPEISVSATTAQKDKRK